MFTRPPFPSESSEATHELFQLGRQEEVVDSPTAVGQSANVIGHRYVNLKQKTYPASSNYRR